MSLGKVKNYIIVILTVANMLSAALLLWKLYTGYTVNNEAQSELLELLNGQGIIISDIPSGTERTYVAERDAGLERTAAAAMIGDCDVTDMGGGIYRYQSANGTAQFRSGGRFEITLDNGGTYFDLQAACVQLLSEMGFFDPTEEYVENILENGNTQLVFGQLYNKAPIFNARAVFEFTDGGKLAGVSGLWLLAVPKPTEDAPCKSAGAVLLMSSGDFGGDIRVEDVRLGLRLETAAPGILILSPEWRVEYNGGETSYLNAYSGLLASIEE